MKKEVFIILVILGICLSGLIFTNNAAARYVGSKESNVYHEENCHYVEKIKSEDLNNFDTPEEAIAAGYRPCKVCKPPESSIIRSSPMPTPKTTPIPTPTPTATPMPTATPTPNPTSTPSSIVLTTEPSPTSISTAKPAAKAPEESGFESIFGIVIILIVAYFMLKLP